MIALIPSEQDAARLAMAGGEPEEELHVTLCYLGKAADWDMQARLVLAAAVATDIPWMGPVEGDAFALSYFNAGTEDKETALVYGIGGDDVAVAHQFAEVATEGFREKIPTQHRPWVAHVTAAYTDDLDAHRGLVGNLGRMTFDRVRVAFGDQIYDIPLGAVEVPGHGADESMPQVELLPGEQDGGIPGQRVREFEDDVVPVPETLRVQADIYADACRVDVDMPGLVAAMGAYAPVRFRGPLAPIGSPTGDRRIFPPNTITQATFPQPLRFQRVGLEGHKGAVAVAAITHAQEGTWEGTPHIVGEGYFLDPEIIPEVSQAIHLIENGVSGPSVDLDFFTANVGEYQGKPILVVQEARQRAATLVAIPAFADLRLTLEYPEDSPAARILIDAMVASAAASQGQVSQALPFFVEHPAASIDWSQMVKAEPRDPAEVDAEFAAAEAEAIGWIAPEDWVLGPVQTEFATTTTNNWDNAPIAPRSSTFDADDAVKRIQAWAGIGTEDADEAKFRSMFLWAKPEQLDQDNVPLGSAGYRLPWGDIFDGKPYLVYHAVYAASALLEGGHGGLPNIPDSDKVKLRNTITKIYARFAEAFDDPNVRASWDAREEASAMELETFAVRSGGWSSLPTSTAAWDEGAARAALDAWADGDMSKYARGFLWFDEANRENKTAYKFPIAKPVDGKLTVFLSAVNNAEARLSSASIPAADKAKILGILNGIQERYRSASLDTVEEFAARFGTTYPSKRAFARRDLKGPTKPVVSADGTEYYGHLALWNTCHLGHSGSGICQKPVHSRVDYKHFYTGTVQTSEGDIIEVGKIMGDGLHAATRRGMTAAAVKRYYEDTSKTFGLVRLYKDRWGIQFSGVPVPGVTEELAQKMRYSEISAHWHPIDNHLEVVAAIAVNRPAFGITASAATEDLIVDESTIVLVEDGVQTGLIASAVFSEEEVAMATGGTEEDCGCGSGGAEKELRAARIMAMEPIPTHAEMAARQARLSAHLNG